MMTRKFFIIFMGMVVTVGAIVFMNYDRVSVLVSCQDPRLFMDGIYYATVQGRRFTAHNSLTIYKRHRGNKVPLGTVQVNSAHNGYFGDNVKLRFATRDHRLEGLLEAQVDGERISTSLVCAQR